MLLGRRQKITIVFFAIYLLVLTVLSHVPLPKLVSQAGVSDKWLHFLAYMNLVFGTWFSFYPDTKADWRKRAVWFVLLGAILYGGIDELTQPYTGRTCDFLDFKADVEGALAGVIIASMAFFWPAFLAVWAITIFGTATLVRADISKLAPVFDISFHIVVYGIFTLIWNYFISLYIFPRGIIGRLLLALSAPIGLMLVVKLLSMLLGRYFTGMEMILSAGAIAVSAAACCFFGLSKKAG